MTPPPLPSLAALRAFEAASRHRSLSAAARELNVTHAAIAQHVRHLETELAEPLLLRAGRGVAPTDAGQRLAQKLGAGFALIAEGVEDLRQHATTRPLAVSLTPSFAMNWLMPRMGSFWQAHPEITVSLTPNAALVDLRRDGFDMAIRFGDGNWPGLEATPLTSGDFWAVAAPGLLAGRHPTTLQELQDDPWLLDAHMLELRRIISQTGFELNATALTMLENNELVLSATLAGLGVSVHPKSIVERDVTSGALIKICALRGEGLAYHMVTLPHRETPNLRIFRKWLLRMAQTAT